MIEHMLPSAKHEDSRLEIQFLARILEFRSRRGFLDQLDIKKDELSMGSKPPVGIWSFDEFWSLFFEFLWSLRGGSHAVMHCHAISDLGV